MKLKAMDHLASLYPVMLLTLHHLHLLPQRHPQPFGGGVSQEGPGLFISWFSRDAVLWFILMLLRKQHSLIDKSS